MYQPRTTPITRQMVLGQGVSFTLSKGSYDLERALHLADDLDRLARREWTLSGGLPRPISMMSRYLTLALRLKELHPERDNAFQKDYRHQSVMQLIRLDAQATEKD